MIHLYTWSTPNGRKISIMLEELGVPYEVHPVDIGNDQQFSPEFLAIAPNNKIPAIVVEEEHAAPLSIFESGAILTYLAETSGRFLAPSGPSRWAALEWLHWQIGGFGPMMGQFGHFTLYAEGKAPYAAERFTKEADRLLRVIERRLAEAPYLAGDEYTIADIACYPWVFAASEVKAEPVAGMLVEKPALHRWLETVGARPAVQRGMQVPKT